MKYQINNICCIGAGYVGGPTMAVIADKCPDITIEVVDSNEERINKWNELNYEKLPIYEPGLVNKIKKCRGRNLHFSTSVNEKIKSADMIFISVNTPTKRKGVGAGKASDLKWVEACARQVAKYSQGHTIVVEKSTVPVRTAEVIKSILNVGENSTFKILSNPEFLSEGNAINDLEDPDRILIGGDNKDAIESLMNIYLRWVKKEKILTTNLWSAELSKLISNAFLAQRISSINSISAICEKTGANIKEVSLAVGKDHRIGSKFLNPGPGFGGSCFKKDISNLVYICKYYGLEEIASYWEKVITINTWQSKRITSIILDKMFGTLSNKKIAVLGFAFKANTNDTRESPAINICSDLLEEGAFLNIYDPKVKTQNIKDSFESSYILLKDHSNLDNWVCKSSILEAVKNCDALLILTEWDEFRNLDWYKISLSMRKPSWVFDTRIITNLSNAKFYGINIWCIGDGQ